jgi:hypothetical protein
MDDWSVPEESQAAIRMLVAEHPILQPILDEEIRADDEILPHLVMAEIARFLGRLVAERRDDPVVIREVEAIIRTLDVQLREGAYSVKNVIAVSFLEQLPSTGEPGTEIRELLTPALRTVFDEVNW